MESFILLLVFLQSLGSLIGAGTAVWGELAYVKAMRDGKVDHAERVHMDAIAQGLRFGMILLLSSFSLVICAYALQSTHQPAFSSGYWTLMLLALSVVVVAWALSRHRVSFAYGSAIIFSGWWYLAFLTLGMIPIVSLSVAIAAFVITTSMFYGLLKIGRFVVLKTTEK